MKFYLHLQPDMSLAVPVGSTDMPFLDIHPTWRSKQNSFP